MIAGRAAELSRCDDLIAGVAMGDSARLLVVGEPGVGKSTLLDAVQRRASRRGLTTVSVHAVEGCEDLPFAVQEALLKALRQHHVPAEASAEQLVPDRHGNSLLHEMDRLTGTTAVLLLLDEAQFADEPSLAALRAAGERAVHERVGVIVATRPASVCEVTFNRWPRLRLDPLPPDAAATVLRAALGPGRPGTAVPALAELLGGNPLALRECAGQLTDDQLDGREPLPEPLPIGAAAPESWRQRLDGLSGEARRMLVDLAVAAENPEVFAALSGQRGALAEAERSGLVTVVVGHGPRFSHPLLRQLVLAGADPARLRARHRVAAACCAELGSAPALVVHHLVRGAIAPDDAVAAAVAQEADRAEDLQRNEEAWRAWEQAARLSSTTKDRAARAVRAVELLLLHGGTANESGRLLDLVGDAELTGRDQCLVEWLRAERRAEVDPAAALTALTGAARHASVEAPDLHPTLIWETAQWAWQQGEPQTALEAARSFAQSASRLPRVPISPEWVGTALLAAGLFYAGDVVGSVPLRREVIRAARSLDPVGLDLDLLLDVVFIDDLLLDVSDAATERLLVAVQRVGPTSDQLACLYGIQGWRARARGDFGAARALLRLGRPLADATQQTAPALGMAALELEIAAICGDAEVLVCEERPVRELAQLVHDRRRLATIDRALGLHSLVNGRWEEALVSLRAAADVPFLGRGLRDAVIPARVDLIELLVQIGDVEEARRRWDLLAPLLDAMDEPLAGALGARAAAFVCADAENADHLLEKAIALHGRAGEPFEAARTTLARGLMLRRRRQRSLARAVLADAVEGFARLGAEPWRRRASEELRACGGQVRVAPPIIGEGALTSQERTVARAAASGRSNREIAELLVLSPRTVEYHLSSAYRKMGVHSRTALASRLTSDVR